LHNLAEKATPVAKYVVEAIAAKNNPFRGASRIFIKKYLQAHHAKELGTRFDSTFRLVFKRLVAKGTLVKSASGDFYRVAKKAKKVKKTKKVKKAHKPKKAKKSKKSKKAKTTKKKAKKTKTSKRKSSKTKKTKMSKTKKTKKSSRAHKAKAATSASE